MISKRVYQITCLLFLGSLLVCPVMTLASSPPKNTMKLVFVHHSVGENWLNDTNGGLGRLLSKNNYFASDTNYGWGPEGIGDRTDIPNWPEWFIGPSSKTYLEALYHLDDKNSSYLRKTKDPGGENRIIMFKSCFPNSELKGRPYDKPSRHGDDFSVSNAKAIYNQLLGYFEKRKDKLFIAVTAPPVREKRYSVNARAFNNWLVNDWLKNYAGTNVAVFDFYNILTGKNNHHKISNGFVEHLIHDKKNTLYYYSGSGDNHPTMVGSKKAAKEFVPLLNYYVSQWKPGEPVLDSVDKTNLSMESVFLSKKQVAVSPMPDGNQIDGFDTENSKWEVFLDNSNQKTKLNFQLDRKTKITGSSSIHVKYKVEPDSWATLSHILPSTMDWSRKSGVSFWIRMPDVQGPVNLVVYNGGHDSLKPFDYKIIPDKNQKAQWYEIFVTWDMFVQPSWAGTGKEKFKPSKAIGIAFAFDESRGSFWVDDLKFLP